MSETESGESAVPHQDYEAVATTKVCPRCSVQSSSASSFCPHCGAPFDRKVGGPRSRRTLLVVAAIALLVLIGGGVGLFLKIQGDNEAQASRETAAQQSALAEAAASEAAKTAAAEAEQAAADAAAEAAADAKRIQDAADERERGVRAEMIVQLEAAIQASAEESVADGLLTGPILRTLCTPVGGGSTDDLTTITGAFSRNAVTEENPDDGTYSGYPYSATIEWDTGSLQWSFGE